LYIFLTKFDHFLAWLVITRKKLVEHLLKPHLLLSIENNYLQRLEFQIE
jgi:hypothetical protein